MNWELDHYSVSEIWAAKKFQAFYTLYEFRMTIFLPKIAFEKSKIGKT